MFKQKISTMSLIIFIFSYNYIIDAATLRVINREFLPIAVEVRYGDQIQKEIIQPYDSILINSWFKDIKTVEWTDQDNKKWQIMLDMPALNVEGKLEISDDGAFLSTKLGAGIANMVAQPISGGQTSVQVAEKTATQLASSVPSNVGETAYINWSIIRPGQTRYSSLNVEEKKQAALKKGDAKKMNGNYVFKYDDGKSILPITSALPVIKTSFGFVLVDGHHDVLVSKVLGAQTVPVKIIADLSNLSESDFWKEGGQAQSKGWIYPYALGGEMKVPANFDDLQDDPYRFFAAIVARKCLDENTSADKTIVTGQKPETGEYPVWIKVGKDIPFIEFKIADVLYNNGFTYTNEIGGNPTPELIEQARDILVKNPIKGLKLIPTKIQFMEIQDMCKTKGLE